MGRKTIIFGNGLGMSLDPTYFLLQTAMNEAWNDNFWLKAPQRDLIKNCINISGEKDQPESENDLDILHRAASSCQFLSDISTSDSSWLTENGMKFPNAVLRYLTRVSWYFHDYSDHLPTPFTDTLNSFVLNTHSHVATLNL